MVDYLHTTDLGVATDCLGNLLLEILRLLPRTRAEKVSNLWHQMQQWYADHRPHNQLQTLTWEMIKKDATSPASLRANSAECRGLIPFGAALANGKTTMGTLTDSLWHTGGDLCVGHICALPGREDSPDLQEVCLALHSLGEGSLGAGGIRFLGGPSQSCTFCRSSWGTLLWKLAPHLDTGRIWMSHEEVGWPQQGPGEEGPTTLPKSH